MWQISFYLSRKMELRFSVFVFYALLISQTVAIQQYFRVVPRSSRVLEGGEVVLECEIAALAGQVQWAKDGFALGFASNIPGHPRYTMIGDRRHGVYNLRIANATLDDDAEYQCQVGPAMAHRVIRANASLTVISPPTSVEIVGHQSNSKIEIRENENISLECLVKNAKPPAKIYWYRGNVELKLDNHSEETIKVESPEGSKKSTRYTTKSKLYLHPTSDDDYADFSCEARHEALQRDFPMRSTVQLSVLYPPGAPYIEGYAEGETVRRGQTLELVCRSRGGNPPAQLIWYKNGEQIRMAYRTAGRVSENVLTFTADASDNKARYRCEAKNVMINNVLKAEIDLTVHFAPTHVSITGPSEARVGDPVPLTCTTAPSNPPAEIKWTVIGKHFKNATSRTVISPEGGWVTTSNITVIVEPNRRSLVVVCHGLNMQLTENVVSTHTINVLYPPSSPLITGYQQGTILAAGTVQRMLCVSSGGNPLATLKWFKNDKEVHSQTKITDKSVSSEITILTNVTDNLAQYKCEAENSATMIPLFESVTLNVHFAPAAVEIDVQPDVLRPGELGNLTCKSASSNPPAALSWWKDGIPVQGLPTTSISGLHGGTVTYIGLLLNLTKEMNGAVYTCQAMNEALQRSVHDARTLRILYAPIFDPIAPEMSMGIEGEPLIIVLKADANPSSVAYTWSKDGLPIPPAQSGTYDRITSEGSMLNISSLSRHDAGVYSCEASNSQGEVTVHINVTVQYAASIKYISESVIVSPGEDATLTCIAVGNPLNEEHIKWSRKGYNLRDHTTSTFDSNGTSYLLIKKASRTDVGQFECLVDNRIRNNKSSQSTMLIVKFQPEMDSAPNLTKSASNQHEVGRLTCKCDSAPAPTFTWSKGGSSLSTNTSGKYMVEYHKLGPITYSSVLLVHDVGASDYGQYVCAAKNEMGNATIRVKLNVTSSPDQVESLTVTNVTHDSVSLSWVPGFDGGMKPTYRIRYRPYDENGYTHKDVIEPNATSYVISELKLGTHYLFSIMAINALGQSKYRPDDIDATTLTSSAEIGELNEVPVELVDKAELPRMVIVYVSITAAVLVAINLVLVSCFFLRRRSKRMKEQAGQASKSATIEMYAPSSYNDTMTGETLSSVSEKSETYSNDGDDLHDPMGLHGHAPPVPDVPTMPSRHTLLQPPDAYLLDDMNDMGIPPPGSMDYPPPNYRAYEATAGDHARTLPHPHHARPKDAGHAHTLTRNSGKQSYVTAPSPMPPLDGSYYNMSSDRYLSYPPLINEYLHQTQIGRTPTPPHQYMGNPGVIQPNTKMANTVMMNGGVNPGSPAHTNNMNGSPPPNYMTSDIGGYGDRQSLGGTLRRRGDKLSAHTQHTHTGNVPPPDVTVLHPGCNQHTRSPQTPGNVEKQPQSILKDPSRHKQYQQYNHGSPLGTSTPLSNTSNQILTVQNLAANDSLHSGVPTYGTIKKENKKNQVNIDDGNKHERETHVV